MQAEDNKIEDADIQSIAENLSDWQEVAKKLGFGRVLIEEIEGNNGPINQAKAFLRKWIAKKGSGATYKKLHDVLLLELEDQGTAEAILGIAKKRYPTVKQNSTDAPTVDRKQEQSKQEAKPHPLPEPQPGVPKEDSYDMKSKPRVAIIINNNKFEHMNHRSGTDKDAEDLKKLFTLLGFKVQLHKDQTTKQMRDVLKGAAKSHSALDCLIVAVLSHGDEGKLYGTDSKSDSTDPNNALHLQDLATYFDGKNCPSLIGKPKVFILQACRGSKYDDGVNCRDGGEAESPLDTILEAEMKEKLELEKWLQAHTNDEPDGEHKLPICSDILYAYSTVPGYYSWRDSACGSWFIQSFIEVVTALYKKDHITDMLTVVNDKVARNWETRSGKKQMPSYVSQLRKKLYFCHTSETV